MNARELILLLDNDPKAYVKMVYMTPDKSPYEASVSSVGFYNVGVEGAEPTRMLTLSCEGIADLRVNHIIELLTKRCDVLEEEVVIHPTEAETPWTIARVDYLDHWFRRYRDNDDDDCGDKYKKGGVFYLLAKQSFPVA